MDYLLVALGGAFGAFSRYGLSSLWSTHITTAPSWSGTLLINVVGGFLIGVFYALSQQEGATWGGWSLLLITGFCGGFTTFSTFGLELFHTLSEGQYLSALLYVLLSVFLTLLAVAGGISIILIKH